MATAFPVELVRVLCGFVVYLAFVLFVPFCGLV
jgi:hypothetical protein